VKANELAHRIAELALDKRATDVLILDIRELTTISDYFIICTADSDVQGRAINDHIVEQLRGESIRPWHVEGSNPFNWILIDFVDVVVHIFQAEARKFYGLERLWGDAKFIEVKEDHEATGTHTTDH